MQRNRAFYITNIVFELSILHRTFAIKWKQINFNVEDSTNNLNFVVFIRMDLNRMNRIVHCFNWLQHTINQAGNMKRNGVSFFPHINTQQKVVAVENQK